MTSQNAKIEDAIFFLISLLFAFQGDGLEIGIQSMRLPRFPFAMLRASAHRNDNEMENGLVMIPSVSAAVKNSGKTRYNG